MCSTCRPTSNKNRKKNLNKILNEHENENIVVLCSALDMLMKFNDIENAEHLFGLIKKKDIIAYSIMMNGYNKNFQPLKCFEIFEQLKKENLSIDETAYTILINSCSQIGMISRSQYIADQIPSQFNDNPYIYNSFIDMWASIYYQSPREESKFGGGGMATWGGGVEGYFHEKSVRKSVKSRQN
jgi:pentatricopeptide repeat protein